MAPTSHVKLDRVGLFPLPRLSLLPGELLPLHVFEPRYRQLVEDVLQSRNPLAVPRLRAGYEASYHGAPGVFPICGVGEVVEHQRLEGGRFHILVRGIGRARILREERYDAYRVAQLESLPDESTTPLANFAPLLSELQRLAEALLPHLPPAERTLVQAARRAPALAEGSDYLLAAMVLDPDARQELLEERDPATRMAQTLGHLEARAATLLRAPAARELN